MIYQYIERCNNDNWEDCSKEWFDYCEKSHEHEVRKLYLNPKKGVKIYTSKDNLYKKQDQLVGVVDRLEGDICHYINTKNEHDMFIWNFKEGLNKFVYYRN